MKSFDTIQKEYLLHRLELSEKYHHFVYCGDSTKATLYNMEIMRLDKIILECFPYETQNIQIRDIDSEIAEKLRNSLTPHYTP